MYTQPRLRPDRWRFARFSIAGAANTVVGYAAIVAALALGLGDVVANAIGYAIGLGLSYTLNRRWTFRWKGEGAAGSLVRFLLVFGLAYGANLVVVLGFRSIGVVDNPLSHLAGIGVYAVIFYQGCGRWVFPDRARPSTDAPPPLLRPERLVARWPEVTAFLLLAVAVVCLRSIPVGHDVVWQMWIARQMLNGVDLYTEILELNPPLWFWMAVPVQWAAEALGRPPSQLILLAVFLYVAVCLLLASRLLIERAPRERAVLLVAILVAMVLIPLPDFGQREHLALVGAIPYALLISRRAERRATSPWLAGSVGLAAAIGFALKHYFIAVPLLLELWLIASHRRRWRPFRPETLVLAASAVGYAVAVVQLSPAFLSTVVPMVRLAYDGYQVPFWALFLQSYSSFSLVLLLALWRAPKSLPPLVNAFGLACIGFALAYFAQLKGWRYHALPTLGCMFVGLGVFAAYWDQPWQKLSSSALAAVMVLALVIPWSNGTYSNPNTQTVGEAMARSEPGDPVMMFTVNASRIWPMVETNGRVWPSRYFTFWMLPAIAAATHASGERTTEMDQLADTIRRHTRHDLLCNPPRLIIWDDLKRRPSMQEFDFDALAFFRQDPELDALFERYERVGKVDHFTIYQAGSAPMPAKPDDCRPIH